MASKKQNTLTGEPEEEAPLDFPNDIDRQVDQDRIDENRKLPEGSTIKRVNIDHRYQKEIRNKNGKVIHQSRWTQNRTNQHARKEYIQDDKLNWFTRYWISILIINGSDEQYITEFSYVYGRTMKGKLTVEEMREISPQNEIETVAGMARNYLDTLPKPYQSIRFNSEYIEHGHHIRHKVVWTNKRYRPIIPGYREKHQPIIK